MVLVDKGLSNVLSTSYPNQKPKPMASSATAAQLFHPKCTTLRVPISVPLLGSNPQRVLLNRDNHGLSKLSRGISTVAYKASSTGNNIVGGEGADEDDGVSLGTMKLPANIDIPKFESLLFQWANSLCQGATLPLPMPLKVDKIEGGARIGFITIGDAKTEVPWYIDCLVFPATGGSAPIFRALRNGTRKDQAPPGEERIMKGLVILINTRFTYIRNSKLFEDRSRVFFTTIYEHISIKNKP